MLGVATAAAATNRNAPPLPPARACFVANAAAGGGGKSSSRKVAFDLRKFGRKLALASSGFAAVGIGSLFSGVDGISGGWSGGGGGGGSSGGGGGGGGGFSGGFSGDSGSSDGSGSSGGFGGELGKWCMRFIGCHAARAEDASSKDSDWDPHGTRVGTTAPVSKLSPSKRYKVSSVELVDQRNKLSIDPKDPFYELVTIRSGLVLNKQQLEAELENLTNCGMFQTVEMDGVTQPDGTIKVNINFVESQWQAAKGLKCINVGLLPQSKQPDFNSMSDKQREEYLGAQEEEYKRRIRRARKCMLPRKVELEISNWLSAESRVTARMLQKIRERIQKWYHEEGYACAQVVNFGNLNTNEIVCEVVEGDITDVQIMFQDKMGLPMEGNTRMPVISRELPPQLMAGKIFNIEAGKKALRNINNLALFSNIEVNPRQDDDIEGGIVVEVKLKELEQKTAEVSTEWSIVPGGSGGRPTIGTIQPGGSVTFEHRNIKGLNRSIICCVTSNNLFNPQDDLGFKMEYVHPYLDGVTNPRDRTFRASCFNSRKLSAVFTGGPGLDEVPAIWIDRAGFKANLTENFTRQSKLTYGLVLEEVTTRDENSAICTNGARILPSGALSMDGPPTTLSDTGIDRVGFFQANLTHDNTKFVNGTPIGSRHIFQVDQGLGIGSKFPLFNRHQLTLTHFLQLKEEDKSGEQPPPVLVLHGRYGGCVGDLPSYDAFTLGGPYSVRGYNMGELAACRNILEAAAEVRIPVKNTHCYGFVEYGTDLDSSKDVRGNPTEFFRRAGHGGSYGVGVKLGLIRAEYARDCNAGAGSLFVRFGERF